ncbi:hypothetical protein Tco_0984728 [Tanacetum coccineum]
MSDSEDSTVTYTEVSSLFEDLSDIVSPGVVGPEYEGLPWMLDDLYVQVVLQDSPSPDYVPGPEELKQAPPLPDFVLEPVHPEFMPPEDEVLLAEEQPLPTAASSTADLPGYVPKSDPEEDPEEEDDEDPEEDLADYPADGGDDEDESYDDDEDDDVHAPSAEETEPFETDKSAATPPPHLAYRGTARISIQDEPPIQIPSPPLPLILSPLLVSSPPPSSPTYPLGYRAAMIRLRAEAPSTSYSPPPHIILSYTRADTPPLGTPPLLPIPLPTSSPSLHLPSVDHGADRPEVCLPPRKRLCFAFAPRYEVGESLYAPATRPTRDFRADYGFVSTMDREIMRDLERDVCYGITDSWDEMLVDMPGAPATDDIELGRRMTEFGTRVSSTDGERGYDVVITELQAADRRRQAAITKLLAADRRKQAQFIEALKPLKGLQTHMTEFQRQQGPAKGPAQPDAPEEAGSSS